MNRCLVLEWFDRTEADHIMQSTRKTQPSGPTARDKVIFLSQPNSYAHEPEEVTVIETHMSWVFLADHLVFKLKKPVKFDHLDFSTIEQRRNMVEEELRLNRRLAPDVYHAAHALHLSEDGTLSIGGEGRIVDWLVEMQRLPQNRNVERMIEQGKLSPRHVTQIVKKLADFYRSLPSERISPEAYVAGFEVEYQSTKETLVNPDLALDGAPLSAALKQFESAFKTSMPALRERAERGYIVEGHGDLRPQHVFLTRPPSIIDCLEFNRKFRIVDPFDEIVFLGMECAQMGAGWVTDALVSALSEALGDHPQPETLEFYWRYRALLRARLALLHLYEVPPRTPRKWRPLTWRYIALAASCDLKPRLQEGR